MQVIKWDADTWRVLSTGAERDGKVYAHLASTTRFVQQKNGSNPVQICDWIPAEVLASAEPQADAITEFYHDRSMSGLASRAQ